MLGTGFGVTGLRGFEERAGYFTDHITLFHRNGMGKSAAPAFARSTPELTGRIRWG